MVRVGLGIAICVYICASTSGSTVASGEQLPPRLRHFAHHHLAARQHSLATVTTSLPKTGLEKAAAVTEISHVNAQNVPPQTRPQAIRQVTTVGALPLPTLTAMSKPAPMAMVSSPDSDALNSDAPDSDGVNMAVVQLDEELTELKQRRANMAQLEQALKADRTLFRESVSLERISTSKQGRKTAKQEALRSAQLVKDTVGILHDSRVGAVDESRLLATEAEQATAAANALTAEASLELKFFGAATGETHDVPISFAKAPVSTTTPLATDDAEDLDVKDEN